LTLAALQRVFLCLDFGDGNQISRAGAQRPVGDHPHCDDRRGADGVCAGSKGNAAEAQKKTAGAPSKLPKVGSDRTRGLDFCSAH